MLLRHGPGLLGTLLTAAIVLGAVAMATRHGDSYSRAVLLLTQENQLRAAEAEATEDLFSIDPQRRRRFRLTATAYCPLCGSDDGQPQSSALGGPVRPGHTIAVSQDLKRLLGRKVYIVGLGLRFVEDLMHPRHSKRIDLCLQSRSQALEFGVKKLEVVVLDDERADGTTQPATE